MKKPILLLIDDDRTVLEALEASLEPRFRATCRVLAFDDPRDVLTEIGTWAKDGRTIAVAIVDQNMPHSTGAELLNRLRMTGPAASMFAAILTGYATLDAALEAKNEAGVARYLEKPWDDAALAVVVHDLLSLYLATTNAARHLVVREVTDAAGVEAIFKLRYDVLRNGRSRWFVRPNEHGLDLDAFDRTSRFLGLFLVGAEDERLVGCVRLASDMPGVDPAMFDRLQVPVRDALSWPTPVFEYIVERDILHALIRSSREAGGRVAEIDRFTRAPWASLEASASRFLQEAALATLAAEGVVHALLACDFRDIMFYERFGFRMIPGTHVQHYPALATERICLVRNPGDLAPQESNRARFFEKRWRSTADVCHCAAYPECFPDGFVSLDFTRVDLLCPRAAREGRRETAK